MFLFSNLKEIQSLLGIFATQKSYIMSATPQLDAFLAKKAMKSNTKALPYTVEAMKARCEKHDRRQYRSYQRSVKMYYENADEKRIQMDPDAENTWKAIQENERLEADVSNLKITAMSSKSAVEESSDENPNKSARPAWETVENEPVQSELAFDQPSTSKANNVYVPRHLRGARNNKPGPKLDISNKESFPTLNDSKNKKPKKKNKTNGSSQFQSVRGPSQLTTASAAIQQPPTLQNRYSAMGDFGGPQESFSRGDYDSYDCKKNKAIINGLKGKKNRRDSDFW